MADELITAPGDTLDEIAAHIHSCELKRKLKAADGCLSTNGGKNYAMLEKPTPSPRRPIKILPSPASPPTGAKKICEGKLTIGGQKIAVTAFRLA